MREVTVPELMKLYGGDDPSKNTSTKQCADELQREAQKHVGDLSYDWDKWAEDYEKCVLGGENS